MSKLFRNSPQCVHTPTLLLVANIQIQPTKWVVLGPKEPLKLSELVDTVKIYGLPWGPKVRFCSFPAGGEGLTPGWGAKITRCVVQ